MRPSDAVAARIIHLEYIYKVVLPFWFVTVVPADRAECLRKVLIASHPCKVLHNYKKKQLIRVENLVGRLTYYLKLKCFQF